MKISASSTASLLVLSSALNTAFALSPPSSASASPREAQIIRNGDLEPVLSTAFTLDLIAANPLAKRKGGGGGGGRSGGGSSSGGSSSGGSSSGGSSSGGSSSGGSSSGGSSSGGSSSGGSSSGGSSSGGSSSSGSSNGGSRGPSGSTSSPASYGGGAYAGGSRQPYAAGTSSPSGIRPFFYGSLVGIGIGAAAGSAYVYSLDNDVQYLNMTTGQNESHPLRCYCQQYDPCSCEQNPDQTYINSLVGNGSYAAMQQNHIYKINNGTLYVDGTLNNGSSSASSAASPHQGWSQTATPALGVALGVMFWCF